MSLTACAALVERGDPNRFLATMAAPPDARRVLFPLYALNLEVARAPWITQEVMIAEMRLQWWRDALEEIVQGKPVRTHEVATPLAGVLSKDTAAKLDQLVAARRWDIYTDPFEDQTHFDTYIDQTTATLLWAAVTSLGHADPKTVRQAGYAQGVANWFRAIPELEARGRIPLVDGRPDSIRRLATEARARLAQARSDRRRISPAARPAMLVLWETDAILRQAQANPYAVGEGRLGHSLARKKLSLMARAASGRW